VTFDQTGAVTLNNVVTGSGQVIQDGTGPLTLGGANTFSGGTTISSGTLGVSNNSALGSGALAMATGTTLQTAASSIDLANSISLTGTDNFATSNDTLELAGAISGTGAISDLTGGTLFLTGANGYSGGTAIGGGTILEIQGDGNLGADSGTLTLGSATNTGTLRFAAGATLSASRPVVLTGAGGVFENESTNASAIDGVISGSGSFTDAGTGTLILAGANTFTGGTSLFLAPSRSRTIRRSVPARSAWRPSRPCRPVPRRSRCRTASALSASTRSTIMATR
jgi:autotransporter-associated beta strand protein